jgi:PEP-CTERM motif
MSKRRVRLQTAVLAFILLPAAVGVLAVHASQTCERFVRTYVSKPVRNRVSKATAIAWEKWRLAHPNWKPNPKLHRPKYLMDHEEAVNKVQFACTIPTEPSTAELFFTPADIAPPPPIIDLPPMDATQLNFPEEVPPEVSEIPPETTNNPWPPFVPFAPPILGGTPELPLVPPPPPPVGAVPEPPSLLLAGLGISSACLLALSRRRRVSAS